MLGQMSELTATRNLDQSGRPLVWLLSLLSLLLLGFVTYAAIRHNPLYTDREAYGISHYKFIEQCKEALHEPGDLTVSLSGQPLKLTDLEKQLPAGNHLTVKSSATSAELVSGVQDDTQNKKLTLISPVVLSARSARWPRQPCSAPTARTRLARTSWM